MSTFFIYATLVLSSTYAQSSPEPTKEQLENETAAFIHLGNLYLSKQQYAKALDIFNQALAIAQTTGDTRQLTAITMDRGLVYQDMGDFQKGFDLLKEALALSEQINNKDAEAKALINVGNAYLTLGQDDNALKYLEHALEIKREIHDQAGEAKALTDIGIAYLHLGQYENGLQDLQRALALKGESHDRDEAIALINIGNGYLHLGQYENALEYFQRALLISREIHSRDLEADALNNIGAAYHRLGDQQRALSFFTQALGIYQAIGNKGYQAYALLGIGYVTDEMGDRKKALAYFAQALPVAREVNDYWVEALILAYTGYTYAEMGNRQKAIDYYDQALPRLTSLGNTLDQAHLLYALFQVYRDDQPGLAIFYGKQAVNYLQKVRENIKGMGEDVQTSFLASRGFEEHPISDYYHSLADLLIGQGRLTEAQQILDLLKGQEYAEYVRGGHPNPANPQPVQPPPALTATESQAEQDYRKSSEPLVALGEQWESLRKIASRTAEQEKQFKQISDQLSQGSQQMNDFYDRQYARFGKNSSANKEVADVKGNAALLRQQLAHMPHTVALYTMVTKDRYSVIVITGATMVAREFPIGENDLNKKIDAFIEGLRQPRQDLKPLAAELYKILVSPVAADLAQAQASTLVWVLDGKLRYVPMSVLYDGKQYLVQTYNSVSILPVSIPHLSEKPDLKRISVIAMGISRQYDNNLNPLPSVVYELDEIVRDPHQKDARGVLPGTILLNGEFTEKAMEDALRSQQAIVHIASHFVFRPGDDSQSYLLLAGKEQEGAGYHLTVADFRDNPQLALDGTQLLTLSACDTGLVIGNLKFPRFDV
jgi:CHAT domain-containing protein/Tfp pilus assembly protein PilF